VNYLLGFSCGYGFPFKILLSFRIKQMHRSTTERQARLGTRREFTEQMSRVIHSGYHCHNVPVLCREMDMDRTAHHFTNADPGRNPAISDLKMLGTDADDHFSWQSPLLSETSLLFFRKYYAEDFHLYGKTPSSQ